MTGQFAYSVGEGHRVPGGLLLLWALATVACGPGAVPEPAPEPAVRFARPLEVYRELGLMTGSGDFPAVASLHTVAGPADSTLLLFGLSLPASALRFHRDSTGFSARYLVSVRAVRDSLTVARVDREETVRVPDFAETGRTDESVVFQAALTLAPGEYAVTVRVRDGLSARGAEAVDTVVVPRYGPGRTELAPPVVVYRAHPRRTRSEGPDLVLNPRHTAPYGRPPLIYLETYGEGAESVRLELRDARGGTVWARDVAVEPGADVAGAAIPLPVDSLPMGRLWLMASTAEAETRPVPFLVTLSDTWLVANFDEALALIRYIASEATLEAMKAAGPVERRRLWEVFWEERDPVPATPVNEYRDAFFERVRTAEDQFGEPNRPGWRTDRGEVYIVLGPPDRVAQLDYDNVYASDRPRAQEWLYRRVPGAGGLRLVFTDRTGFGAYRLVPESDAAFRAAAWRLKERAERP